MQGWGDLTHTLVEYGYHSSLSSALSVSEPSPFIGIDHIVLNVGRGELQAAIAYYKALFGFQQQQSFAIQTDRSALYSQVLAHPDGTVQLPINEPASTTSQIQEFLTLNRGAGIQHIALQVTGIVKLVRQLRQRGLSFLQVPSAYYDNLRMRSGFQLSEAEWQAVAAQEILVDWQSEEAHARLFQIFTQPIFEQPTFFFELIERGTYWKSAQYHQATGFGEGNFQALFEAIEREQAKRGSLG